MTVDEICIEINRLFCAGGTARDFLTIADHAKNYADLIIDEYYGDGDDEPLAIAA